MAFERLKVCRFKAHFSFPATFKASSETQGQIVGTRESPNGLKNVARRKVKNGEKSNESMSSVDSSVHLIDHGPSDLGSLILVLIIPQERTPSCSINSAHLGDSKL